MILHSDYIFQIVLLITIFIFGLIRVNTPNLGNDLKNLMILGYIYVLLLKANTMKELTLTTGFIIILVGVLILYLLIITTKEVKFEFYLFII